MGVPPRQHGSVTPRILVLNVVMWYVAFCRIVLQLYRQVPYSPSTLDDATISEIAVYVREEAQSFESFQGSMM